MKKLIDIRIFWISLSVTLIIAVTGIGLLGAYERMHPFEQGETLADSEGDSTLFENNSVAEKSLFLYLADFRRVVSMFPPAKLLFWLYDCTANLLFFAWQ